MDDGTVYTFCRICETRCRIEVTVKDNRVQRIAPDRQHVHNFRDFCVKGKNAHELVEHPRRLKTPMKRVGERYIAVSWDEALNGIADHLTRIIERDGPDAVGIYNGNPWAFSFSHATFAGAFMDALGSLSRFNVGSIDQHSDFVASELMYGSALMPLVPDVDDCDHFLFIGMNPAESRFNWIGAVPDGWTRVKARVAQGAALTVVDPRRTPTARAATRHVSIQPGEDWAFLLALIKVIFDRDLAHSQACADLDGVAALRRLAGDADLAELAVRCDVPPDDIQAVACEFATARTAMAWAHTGVSMTPTGTVGAWLVHALNAITNRTDVPGGRRFERGFVDIAKLWDTLAPKIDAPSRVRGLPKVINSMSLAELPEEILTPGPGRIRAFIIDAGNPVVSGPDGEALDAALADLECLVAVDLVQRESHRHAHWLIPGYHWLERDELHPLFQNLEEVPFIQYAFRAVDPPPGMLEEWEFFVELALRMNRPLFGRPGVNGIIEASRLMARALGRPELAFNPHWVSWIMVRLGRRLRWKDIKARPHGWVYGQKEFGNLKRALRTPSGRIQVAPPPLLAEARRLLSDAVRQPEHYPFIMISRRRLQSMNSGLNELPGIYPRGDCNGVEIHPEDATRLGVEDGDRVTVSSPVGAIELDVTISRDIRPGVVAVEHGWGSSVLDPAGNVAPDKRGANRNLLTSNRDLDPLSQIPAFNRTFVTIASLADEPRTET